MEPKIKRPLWEPWRLALLFAAAIPLFPDFSTPVWAAASLIAARREDEINDLMEQHGHTSV